MVTRIKDLKDHPAHQYAEDVRHNRVVACRWVKLAVERYFHDIQMQKSKGFYFDRDSAEHVIDFYQLCPHYQGEWAGQTIQLEPFQQFVVWNVFGWKWKKTHTRRFKVVYQTVARKNGKTTCVSPIGLYMLYGDNEPGAQVYSAAHDRGQAREVFDAARAMINTGPLKSKIECLRNSIVDMASISKFEPITADEKSHHGKNIHAAICDEVHVWPKRGLWSVLRTGMGARRQPIIWAITTAGDDMSSICYELHEYTQMILKGFKEGFNDETFFGMIYTLDTKKDWPDLKTKDEYKADPNGIMEDDWIDESVWIKANPNLNISVKIQDIRDEAKKAEKVPASLNDFLRLRMNIWTQQFSRWIDLREWDANNTKEVYIYV